MSRKTKKSERILFQGEVENVRKWLKGNIRDFWIFISIILTCILLFIYIDSKFLHSLISFSKENVFFWIAIISSFIFYLTIFCIIQPLRITERGIYPPTRGIINIFLMRERFIPFSEIKEFRIYNPSLEKFPEEWARMSKREREEREILESEYDIVLKNGKVIKMSSWTTAFYFGKNLPSVKKIREFRDILLRINEELKKGKTVIRKEDIIKGVNEK